MTELTNIASERAVLAGICKYGIDSYSDVEVYLDEETFSIDYNKVLYSCVKHVLKKESKIDFVSILSAGQGLLLGEYLNKPEVLRHIHGIIETPIDINAVKFHAQKIRRLQFARHLQSSIKESWNTLTEVTGDETISTILAGVEKPIQDAGLLYTKQEDNQPEEVGFEIEEFVQHLMENEGVSIGVPSGFPSYDAAIGGGFRRKCIDLIGARSKMGKSLLGQAIASYVGGTLHFPVLILDTEMSKSELKYRMLANLSEVPISDIERGLFKSNPDQLARVNEAKLKMKDIRCKHINVTGRPFEETMSIARRWVLKDVGFTNGKTNDCLIIYDYFKITDSSEISSTMGEHQALGFQMIRLHNFVVEHDCSCLAFAQLNRDGINKETIDTIAGSDRLVHSSTSVTLFKDKGAEEIANDGPSAGNKKLVPLVSRHGPGMDDGGYICLEMRGHVARIREIGQVRTRRDFPTQVPVEESNSDNSYVF